MSGITARRSALLLALDLGILGDYLLRAEGPWGLNLAIWALAGVVAVTVVCWRRGLPREVCALLLAALLFSALLAWRDTAMLRAVNGLLAAGTAALAGGAAAGAWLRHAGVVDYAVAAARSALSAAAGPALLWRGAPGLWSTPSWSRPALAALRGGLIATPLLVVFGSMLMAADPVFAALVDDTLRFDPELVVGHAVLVAVLTWGSAGYLSRYVAERAPAPRPLPLPQVRIGLVDGAVALGLLNLLFLVFIGVQLRYLFGGADLVALTPGLTYAGYARRGFFELVAVAALVVPVLLVADWSVRREQLAEQWVFRGLAFGQVLLLFAILGSALYRMHIYRESYGLTEQRLYATVFMGWLAFVLAWLSATVLRGRRDRFAFGALASALAVGVLLNFTNPQALVVHGNVERAASGESFDVAYAGGLSGDAVPALVATLGLVPAAERCRLAGVLLEEWGREQPGDWRGFNYGDWRARRTVAGARARLQAVACARPAEAAAAGAAPGPAMDP